MKLYEEAWNFVKIITRNAMGIWDLKEIIKNPTNLRAYNETNKLNLEVAYSLNEDVSFYINSEEETKTPSVKFSTLLIFNINNDIDSLKNSLRNTSNDFVKFCLEKRIKEIEEEKELQDEDLINNVNDSIYTYLSGFSWGSLKWYHIGVTGTLLLGSVHSSFWDVNVHLTRVFTTSKSNYAILLYFQSKEGVLRRKFEYMLNDDKTEGIFLADNSGDLVPFLLDENSLVRFLAEKRLKILEG